MVVLVYLEVLGEIVDPPRQQSDLDLRRTGVTLIGRVPGDDLLLDCCVQRHVRSLSCSVIPEGTSAHSGPTRVPENLPRRGMPRADRLRVQPTQPTTSATMYATTGPAC